jgi:carbon-monoxide dehydrogenase large subunit
VENLPLEGALTVTFVRSLLAHADIVDVDATAAEALPNVQVMTAADMDLGVFGPWGCVNSVPPRQRRLFCRETVFGASRDYRRCARSGLLDAPRSKRV